MGYLLPKAKLHQFLLALMAEGSFVAPVNRKADNVVVYEELTDSRDLERLDLSINPQFSHKKFFMPAYEELFTYDMQTQQLTDRKMVPRRRILFGLRLCDLNAVKIQDALFLGKQYADDHYKKARDHLVLVGWYCNKAPSPYCFCGSMELTHYYDVMLRDLSEKDPTRDLIYIDVNSPTGILLMTTIVEKLRHRGIALKEHHEQLPPIMTKKKLVTRDIRKHFDNPLWTKTANEKCLSCERCTTMCPTCMCYDVYDSTEQDLRHGTRIRTWDSCHSKEFTRVAGGHIFRPARDARFKHRIYHKLTYYPEVFGTPMCTGCGRCIEHCPTTIDFVEIINTIEKQKTQGNHK